MNICIIQARLTSSRLPNKVLFELNNKTVIEHIYERMFLCKKLDKIVFAIPNNAKNDLLSAKLNALGYEFYRGDEDDVLYRYYVGAVKYNANIILRVTADCPFVDYNTADDIIEFIKNKDCDYVTREGLPVGISSEAFSFKALENAYQNTTERYQREHVVSYFMERTDIFSNYILEANSEINRPQYRLTLDTIEDWELIRILYKNLYKGKPIPTIDLVKYLDRNNHLLKINMNVRQKSYHESS